MPEHILSKPGPLTPEEFQKVQAHPQVGADIIAAVPFPYPVAPLILSHHERWDGRGYPLGLKGEDIPLGARILCLVDYFDALDIGSPVSRADGGRCGGGADRAGSRQGARPALRRAFLRVLPRVREEAEGSGNATGGRSPAARHDRSRSAVFDDIAVAHGEIYALYQIAQTMGTSLGVSDTMALIASKLTTLVPFSACTLFLIRPGDATRSAADSRPAPTSS